MSKKIGILSLLILLTGLGCKPAPEQTIPPAQQAVTSTASAQELRTKQVTAEYQILQQAAVADTDLDGLSNEEEKKFGTNVKNADSDGDGLLDGDEIKTFKTNPINADTDSDGKKDGQEIKSGGNPLDSKK